MFKSLQARLMLSYLLIILVCLALVGLAAWVLLRGYQRSLIFSRLNDRTVLAARLAGELLRRGASPQIVVGRLTDQISRGGELRLSACLLEQGGGVVASSNDRICLPPFPVPAGPTRGEWQMAGGERLLYVAEPVPRDTEGNPQGASYVLVLAEPFPVVPVVRTALRDLLSRIVWAGAIALALSVIVAALIAYSIARPLDRIAEAAEEIAAGNYDQQLNISAPSEVTRLATSFNSMARQVKATLQSQRDFVANVSHDLKTPLTSIQGFSQALLDGTARDQAARKRAATVIHKEAGRMRRLVDDLLDLARLEAGHLTLAREPVDIREVLRVCVDRFGPQSRHSGVTLELEVPATLPPVLGDADRLGQVVGNLVDNALKHAGSESEAGRVVLRAKQQDGLVICSVTDNGPGIPAQDLPRIFERFYQVDKSRARREDASPPGIRSSAGLGLAITQEIVRAHGGQIGAESVEGLGTRFTVELPIQD
ncbi:MAG: HAMP domain-containing sensor histidine kinase [Anaerolineae bacterium]